MIEAPPRWQQRYSTLQAAYRQLCHAVEVNGKNPADELIQMALIKGFEMTFELSWKTIKDYLTYNGIDVKLPREVIKQAFSNGIVSDGQVWIDMLQDRNLMAHTYDVARAQQAVSHIRQRYMAGLESLCQFLQAEL